MSKNSERNPKFQKRHYEAIAAAMCRAFPEGNMIEPWEKVREELANTFEWDNVKFNRDRFLNACETTN